MAKSTGLGQGVGLLFGETETQEKYFQCEIDKILPNKHQPRTYFDQGDLAELAESIRQNGVIQPLIVTRLPDGDTYELVAGERRLRASKLAKLATVPVVVIDVTKDDSLLELALIENIQRTDLNPIEEAEAYQKLIKLFGYTQEETAKRIGKNRSTVANMLRLLNLPENIQQDVITGTLSEGHARVLLRLTYDLDLLKKIRDQIVLKQLTVRQTEKLVKSEMAPAPSKSTNKPAPRENNIPTSYYLALSNQLANKLGTKVVIQQNGTRGKLEIEFYSHDDLERLMTLILAE